jgi:Right handed beta helix region
MGTRPSHRSRLALVVATAALALPADAGAANINTNCADLQDVLNASNNGDVITITEASCMVSTQITFPKTKSAPFSITLRGSGAGTTLDGTNLPPNDSLISVDVPAAKFLGITLRNLTLQNSTPSGTSGGALFLGGEVATTIDDVNFLGNSSDSSGGAAYLQGTGGPTVVKNSTFGGATAALANLAFEGGGLYVANFEAPVIITGNRFIGNHTLSSGGGVRIDAGSVGNPVTVTGNLIDRNTTGGFQAGGLGILASGDVTLLRNIVTRNVVRGDSETFASGGGAAIGAASAGVDVVQGANVFDRNRVEQNGTTTDFFARGAGEFVSGADSVTSTGDRFTNNTLAAALGTGEAEGAGLSLIACGQGPGATSVQRLQNLVAAGNTALGEVEGAGVYVGCAAQPADLRMVNSTVAGNVANGAGSTSGLHGDADDKLVLRNSIVTGNPGGANVAGFATRSVSRTDACNGAAPLPGTGNICANPLLVNPGPGHADVHQRRTSPTVDAGLNSFLPVGLTVDFEGQKRVLGPSVDMGADEFRDTVAPVLSKLSIEPTKLKPGQGAQIFYRLSEPARVKFPVQKRAKGRKVGGKCVKPTKKNKDKPACKRWVKVGKLPAQTATAGKNVQSFAANVGGRNLKPGTYRVVLTATDFQANRSKPKRVSFKVRKP